MDGEGVFKRALRALFQISEGVNPGHNTGTALYRMTTSEAVPMPAGLLNQ
jgi:hypothetical protein